jgi:hypothetical protein
VRFELAGTWLLDVVVDVGPASDFVVVGYL